jgi:hypothetical protein
MAIGEELIRLIRVKIEWAKKHLRNLAAETLTLQHTTVVSLTTMSRVGVRRILLTFKRGCRRKTFGQQSRERCPPAGRNLRNRIRIHGSKIHY